MTDLFAHDARLERLPVPGADLAYMPALPGLPAPHRLLERLLAETPWRQETVTVWGKKHMQPRLTAWYGDLGRSYTYSGIRLEPLPWTSLLLEIRSEVERAAGAAFNSVLLNLYRDHNDRMGFHSDDEPELGPQPVIASLSLGAERTFILKSKRSPELAPVRLKLQSGSLLIMRGSTQMNWKHGIDRESKHCGPRVNLTFRQIGSPR